MRGKNLSKIRLDIAEEYVSDIGTACKVFKTVLDELVKTYLLYNTQVNTQNIGFSSLKRKNMHEV